MPSAVRRAFSPAARLRSLSLKGKLTFIVIALFILFIWSLTWFAATVLQSRFEKLLFDQQFASVQRLAADIDGKLAERVGMLTLAAEKAPADLGPAAAGPYLQQLSGLHIVFSGGVTIIGLDGKAIADYPVTPGRRGTYFGDRAYFREVLARGRPHIDKPVIGRALKRPVLTIGVPVLGADGKVRAVLTGITDLTAPNFLGTIADRSLTGKSEFFIFAPQDNLVVAATDSRRAMTPMPPRGVNAPLDHFLAGFEGSTIGVNSEGISKLYSGASIKSARWLVAEALPTEVALAPLVSMRRYAYALAALMTVLAFLAIRWTAARVLAPLDRASRAMHRMTAGATPLVPLPVDNQDEVGSLIRSFNSLVEDRKRHEADLAESEQRFRLLVEHAPDAIYVQTGGRFTYLNAAAALLFGAHDKALVVGQPVEERIDPAHRPIAAERFRRIFEDGATIAPQEGRYLRMDGTSVPVEVSAVPLQYRQEPGALVFMRDISERKRAEQVQLRLNRALRLRSHCNMVLVHAEREQGLLDEVCRLIVGEGGYLLAWVGVPEQNAEKAVRVLSHAGRDSGYVYDAHVTWDDSERGRGPVGTCIRTGRMQIARHIDHNDAMTPWQEAAAARGYRACIALPLTSKQDTFGALAIYAADPEAFEEEEVKLLHELANDLAFGIRTLRMRIEREAAREQLSFLMHHDALTHLPDRVLLRDRFDRAVASVTRNGGKLALLLLDLDNFKRVNDGVGHAAGDQVLQRVVERMQRQVRRTDTVSRHGGDEFVILLDEIRDPGVVSQIAQGILDAVSEPFEVGSETVTTSFSIGISFYPDDAVEFDVLLRHADAALFHAKDSGRNTYRYFAASMNVDALAHMQLHASLRRAVAQQQFVLHYQPQVDLRSGRLVGAEALVRWQREDGELVPPDRFIPLAEESGLIVQLGKWVLFEACRQARRWEEEGLQDLVVAVNLSAQQFKRDDLLATVRAALDESGLDPARLELELTESILLQNTRPVVDTLNQFKALGIQLSIDDFGTGYSSFAYLKRLSIDKLKIDQSFVRDADTQPDSAAIVRAIVQLGHTLQQCVIAEGVETEAQLALLREYGCDQVQGYLFSRPLPAAAFAEFARRPRSAAASSLLARS